MSRVDDALRIWRAGGRPAAAAAATTDPATTDDPSRPVEYPSEGDTQDPIAGPTVPRPIHLVEPVRKTSETLDLEARLVTATSSTVSIEQYSKLAAVLHEEQVQHQLKKVMISSALPGEGKTLTLVNLALTLSGAYGRRVVVVDADLRRPSLHEVLQIPNDRGLSEALRERDNALRITEVSSLLGAVTAGKPGPRPLSGLTSARMGDVLEECAGQFDWVLIDTPPVAVLPDAQVLARLVGGIVLVIGAGSTPAAAVARAVTELGGPDAIIGTVLNRVEERRVPEAGYYVDYHGYKTSRPKL